ncbi:unnamed protein product, partial [Pelagomonas calceolata]
SIPALRGRPRPLALERSGLGGVADDLGRVRADLVPVAGLDGGGVEQGGHEADGRGAVHEEVARVVEVDARRRVQPQHGQGRGDGLDPRVRAGDAREDLLQRRAELVGVVRLRRRLAARDDHDVALHAPLDDLGHEDGRDDELGARVARGLGVRRVHDRAAADHDVAVVLGAEVGERVEAARRRQRELGDLEAALDRRRHGLGARLGRRRAQHGADAVAREAVEHALAVRLALRVERPARASVGGCVCVWRRRRSRGGGRSRGSRGRAGVRRGAAAQAGPGVRSASESRRLARDVSCDACRSRARPLASCI